MVLTCAMKKQILFEVLIYTGTHNGPRVYVPSVTLLPSNINIRTLHIRQI